MSNVFNFDDDEQIPFGSDPAQDENGEAAPEESEGGNKTFMIAAIALGSIFLLSLLCAAGYFLLIFPKQQTSRLAVQQTATAVQSDAATMVAMTEQVLNATPTLAPTATFTPVPTNTPVLFEPPTATLETAAGGAGAPAAGGAAATQTQQAADATSTQQKVQQMTNALTPQGTPSLATTGFADEVGLPGLFIAALLMVAILFLARRMRTASTQR
ncbi:MAG: hypothetical protein OHK0031_04010 [Anaerolineales bacterium]